MNCSKKFLAATALVGAVLQGCATTGLPEYRSVDAGTRTANTSIDTQSIRYYPNGEPVAIQYDACSALRRATNNITSNRTVERSIDQGARNIGNSAGTQRGRDNFGNIIVGAATAVGAAIAGNEINKTINTPQIRKLDADCNQQTARKDWEAQQRVNARHQQQQEREADRAMQQNTRAAQREISYCISSETRRGESYPQARQTCLNTILGGPNGSR